MKGSATILGLAVYLLGGCAPISYFQGSLLHRAPGMAPNAATTPKASVETTARKVSFPLEGSPMPDHKNPETLVDFALKLADKGEPAKAAAFLLEAADLKGSDSKANEFRIAVLATAATLYLEAGEIQSFHDAVSRLRAEMDRFQLASADPKIQLLFAISDQLAGRRPTVSSQIPGPVQELFRTEDRRQR